MENKVGGLSDELGKSLALCAKGPQSREETLSLTICQEKLSAGVNPTSWLCKTLPSHWNSFNGPGLMQMLPLPPCYHLSCGEGTAAGEMSVFPSTNCWNAVLLFFHPPKSSLVPYLGSTHCTSHCHHLITENDQSWACSLPKEQQPVSAPLPWILHDTLIPSSCVLSVVSSPLGVGPSPPMVTQKCSKSPCAREG